MKSILQLRSLLLTLILLSLNLMATPHTYPSVAAKVPFEFSVGKRVFSAGEYRFAAIGVGRMAVLDSHKKVLAVFLTRTPEAPSAIKTAQLLFQKGKKHAALTRISTESGEQEILGEEAAGHDTHTESVPVESFMEPGDIATPRTLR